MPLQTAGQGFLSGATQALPSIYSQIANLSGTSNPFGGGTQVGPQTASGPNARGGVSTPNQGQVDPYELTGPHLLDYNNRAGQINQLRQQALKQFESSTDAKGLGMSGLKAYKLRLNNHFDNLLQDELTSASQNQYNAKQSALNAFLQSATQQAQLGAGMIGQNVGALQNQQQVALQNTNTANNALFGLGGFIYNALNPSVPQTQSGGNQGFGGAVAGAGGSGGQGGLDIAKIAQLAMLLGGGY